MQYCVFKNVGLQIYMYIIDFFLIDKELYDSMSAYVSPIFVSQRTPKVCQKFWVAI